MRIGSENFLLFLLFAKSSVARGKGECATHGDCSYGASCINKKCNCYFDCRSFYPLTYKSDAEIAESTTCIKIGRRENGEPLERAAVASICMAQAEACAKQTEVKIECIGPECDITSGKCSARLKNHENWSFSQLCKKDNVCHRNIEGTSGICLRNTVTKEKKCECGAGRGGAKCEKYLQVQRDREVEEKSMLFGTALVVVTMCVVLAMVAVSRWCYKDKKELKRKSTARIELSNSVSRHLHRLDPVSSRSESRVETSLITCAAINGVHFPMSILMNRSYCHGGRVDNIPFSASEMTDLSSDDFNSKYCSKISK